MNVFVIVTSRRDTARKGCAMWLCDASVYWLQYPSNNKYTSPADLLPAMAQQQAVYATDEVRSDIFLAFLFVIWPPDVVRSSIYHRQRAGEESQNAWCRGNKSMLKTPPFFNSQKLTQYKIKSHILAARTVSNIVKTSLGPRGLFLLFVNA